jgi:hypothetical protein
LGKRPSVENHRGRNDQGDRPEGRPPCVYSPGGWEVQTLAVSIAWSASIIF